MTRTLIRRTSAWAAPGLLAAVLAGCGGGGNNSAPAAPVSPASTTLSGTIVAADGTPEAGYRVVFDGNSGLTATTNGQGQFTLTVPGGGRTGNDTLTVYDSQGSVVLTQSVTATGSGTTLTVTIPMVPPPPTNLNPSARPAAALAPAAGP